MTEKELVDTWRALLERYHTTSCALDRALREGHRLGGSEFEVLDALVEAERDAVDPACANPSVRMLELGARVQLSQSALSRVVARLETDGLVARVMCADDRRRIFVTLTDTGRRRHAAASTTHRAVLADHLAPAPIR